MKEQLQLFPVVKETEHGNAVWDTLPSAARAQAVTHLASIMMNAAQPDVEYAASVYAGEVRL